MSFDTRVESHHKLSFDSNVRLAVQQEGSRLRPYVTEQTCTSEGQVAADEIGALEYRIGETRPRSNPENVAERTRTWLNYRDPIETGQYFDKADKFRQIDDSMSSVVRGHARAIRRGFDDRILGVEPQGSGAFKIGMGGILGKVTRGKLNDGVGSSSLPAAQQIAVNSSGLTLDKLKQIYEGFGLADYDLDMINPVMAISPRQNTDLLAIVEAAGTNLNLAETAQIVDGRVRRLVSIDFIITNRLPKTGTTRTCAAWMQDAVTLGIWQDLKTDMWNDTSALNTPYGYCSAHIDAARTQDSGVYSVDCTES